MTDNDWVAAKEVHDLEVKPGGRFVRCLDASQQVELQLRFSAVDQHAVPDGHHPGDSVPQVGSRVVNPTFMAAMGLGQPLSATETPALLVEMTGHIVFPFEVTVTEEAVMNAFRNRITGGWSRGCKVGIGATAFGGLWFCLMSDRKLST